MPRDANGNYTLPAGNPVISGTPITTVWANPTLQDVAAEITNSLSRDGEGGMLVPFKNQDGAVATPGITWTNETKSGFYRAGVNDMRASINGIDSFRWDASGVYVWNVVTQQFDEISSGFQNALETPYDSITYDNVQDGLTAALTAIGTFYNNTSSTLTATDVKNALDELAAEIDAIFDAFTFQGIWNANTNIPDLLTIPKNNGDYWVCDVAGTTDLGFDPAGNPLDSWIIGDKAVYINVTTPTPFTGFAKVKGSGDGILASQVIFDSLIFDINFPSETSPDDVQEALDFGWPLLAKVDAGYTASEIDFVPTIDILSTDVQAAIVEVDAKIIGIVPPVDSVFGRINAVVAESGDYTALQVVYDNVTSGLLATEVQTAIDEVNAKDGGNVKLAGTQVISGSKDFTIPPTSNTPIGINDLVIKSYVDGLDGQNVKLSGAQSVAGKKIFSDAPESLVAPVAGTELVNKTYLETVDGNNVKLTGDQTVDGQKTFVLTPLTDAVQGIVANELTRKDYVDGLDGQNVKLTTAQTVAGVKTFSSNPISTAVQNNAITALTRVDFVTGITNALAGRVTVNEADILQLQSDINLIAAEDVSFADVPEAVYANLQTAVEAALDAVTTRYNNADSVLTTTNVKTSLDYLGDAIQALVSGFTFEGTWDANANVPDIGLIAITSGQFWVVTTAGATSLPAWDGGAALDNWVEGDRAVYLDGSGGTGWAQLPNTTVIPANQIIFDPVNFDIYFPNATTSPEQVQAALDSIWPVFSFLGDGGIIATASGRPLGAIDDLNDYGDLTIVPTIVGWYDCDVAPINAPIVQTGTLRIVKLSGAGVMQTYYANGSPSTVHGRSTIDNGLTWTAWNQNSTKLALDTHEALITPAAVQHLTNTTQAIDGAKTFSGASIFSVPLTVGVNTAPEHAARQSYVLSTSDAAVATHNASATAHQAQFDAKENVGVAATAVADHNVAATQHTAQFDAKENVGVAATAVSNHNAAAGQHTTQFAEKENVGVAATAVSNHNVAASQHTAQFDAKLDKTGGTVTGQIVQALAPVATGDLANKAYVDANSGGGFPPPPFMYGGSQCYISPTIEWGEGIGAVGSQGGVGVCRMTPAVVLNNERLVIIVNIISNREGTNSLDGAYITCFYDNTGAAGGTGQLVFKSYLAADGSPVDCRFTFSATIIG